MIVFQSFEYSYYLKNLFSVLCVCLRLQLWFVKFLTLCCSVPERPAGGNVRSNSSMSTWAGASDVRVSPLWRDVRTNLKTYWI